MAGDTLAPNEPEQTEARANVEGHAGTLTREACALLDLLVDLALSCADGDELDEARTTEVAGVPGGDP